MGNSILLITTIYPRPSKDGLGTKVCHYFASEWVKSGYNVTAVHIQTVYPLIFYWIAKFFRKLIVAKTSAVVYTNRENAISKFTMDGVNVIRIPVFKLFPHGRYNEKSYNRALSEIIEYNKGKNNTPEYIIGHFPNPQLRILFDLKKQYEKSKTCQVLHLPAEIEQLSSVYGRHLDKYMRSIDIWGFRFKHLKEIFEEQFGQINNSFICYSGIPSTYIKEKNREVKESVANYIFVGEMIERKYPIKVLDALRMVYPQEDYSISFVGEGKLKTTLKDIVNNERLENSVRILGKIPREDIINEYDNADCFIMISKGEAYGLVYLEAMARGCITIASKDEGFDGVIKDGENGFLCDAGNAVALAEIIRHINQLSKQERQRISDNAWRTALNLTDEKAANLYLHELTL